MSKLDVHFKSNSDEYSTPQYIFDYYNKIYYFDFDICSTADNTKCEEYATKDDDILNSNWDYGDSIWCNPPYSQLRLWIEKAYTEVLYGVCRSVVMLIPARTDTITWHKYICKGDVTFLKGRLKFSNSKNSAPFPSAIVVFNRHILLNTKGSTQYLEIRNENNT